jgi:peptidoglycan L-alanyl-D-glutamate endopeptidase CwlK
MRADEIKQLARKPVNKDRQSDMGLLAPFVREAAEMALFSCHQAGYMIYPFETFRSELRQQELYNQGRTTPGKIVTYAKPGYSYHNWSLALDCVFKDKNKWVWDGPYEKVHVIFEEHGFETLAFEKAHFQMTGGLPISAIKSIARVGGIEAVWAEVLKHLK